MENSVNSVCAVLQLPRQMYLAGSANTTFDVTIYSPWGVLMTVSKRMRKYRQKSGRGEHYHILSELPRRQFLSRMYWCLIGYHHTVEEHRLKAKHCVVSNRDWLKIPQFFIFPYFPALEYFCRNSLQLHWVRSLFTFYANPLISFFFPTLPGSHYFGWGHFVLLELPWRNSVCFRGLHNIFFHQLVATQTFGLLALFLGYHTEKRVHWDCSGVNRPSYLLKLRGKFFLLIPFYQALTSYRFLS